jgi:hypothetical protein
MSWQGDFLVRFFKKISPLTKIRLKTKSKFLLFLTGQEKKQKNPLRNLTHAMNPVRTYTPVTGWPVDGKKRHQKSLHSSLSHSLTPPKFRAHPLFKRHSGI